MIQIRDHFVPFLLLTVLVLQSCTSGKKALKYGNYDASVVKSVNRLKQSPNNKKAREVLNQAYPLALQTHRDNIVKFAQHNDALKWEKIAYEYKQINMLYNQIQYCPSCKKIIKNPQYYSKEYDDARQKGAEVRYDLGIKAMAEKQNRLKAKEAYNHFMVSQDLMPGYKDLAKQMDEALYYATLKVVVQPIPMHSRTLKISNEFFENKIHEFLHNMPVSQFVRFYTPAEAKAEGLQHADQVIVMEFDNFSLGNVMLKENEREVSKDSVVIATKNDEDIYGTVKATVKTTTMSLIAKGLLDFKVIDDYTNKVITQEKFPGQFTWSVSWGNFNGDDRALSDDDRVVIKNKAITIPPGPQELFVQFTGPIYDQLTLKIRDFYRQY